MALLFLTGFIAIIALPSVLWLYALADVIINDFRSLITKFVWMLFLCFFPPLGTLLYFLSKNHLVPGRQSRGDLHPARARGADHHLYPLFSGASYTLHGTAAKGDSDIGWIYY